MDRKWKSGASGVAPAAADNASDGFATAGNPGGGVPATKPGPYWYHMVTEEILAVIAAASIPFDKTVLTQLRDAIAALAPQAASQSEQETGGVLTKYVSPGRQLFHPSAVKFWCEYNGTLAGPITPSVDYNVVDVTDNGAGDQTVNIGTDFSSGNWSPYASSSNPETQLNARAAGTIRIFTRGSGGTLLDAGSVSVGGFGDQ